MPKIFYDFKIKADHLIPARRLDLVLINNKKCNTNLVNVPFPVN